MTTLLLTRPKEQSARFADAVAARLPGVPVVISPVLEIVPRDGPVSTEGIAAFILTSENGARTLAARADVAGRTAYCVGDRTAQAARAAGMDAVSAGGAAEDLVALIRARRPLGRLLFARGAESRGAVAERLAEAGLPVESVVLYDQRPRPLTPEAAALLAGAAPVIAPVFSPRSAALLSRAEIRAPLILVALSEAVARAWDGPAPQRVAVAAHPDAASILDSIAANCPAPPA